MRDSEAASIRRCDARCQDGFEMLGAVAIGVGEELVGDAAQYAGSDRVAMLTVSSLVRSRTIAWMALM